MQFPIEPYLARLGVEAPPTSADGLALLQAAQLEAIAFENLDPLTDTVPDLSPAALEAKLLASGRGGYCFELNGLFGRALAAFGFRITPVLARVRRPGVAEVGPRSHLAFIVELEGREWLADVGFGGPGARWPVLIEAGRVDRQGGDCYRIVVEDSGETVLFRQNEGEWVGVYGFDRIAVMAADIAAANFLCARWEWAPFSANLMLNRLTPEGRVSAFNTAVTEIRGGERSTRTVRNADELAWLLAHDFGLEVGPTMLAAVASKLGLH